MRSSPMLSDPMAPTLIGTVSNSFTLVWAVWRDYVGYKLDARRRARYWRRYQLATTGWRRKPDWAGLAAGLVVAGAAVATVTLTLAGEWSGIVAVLRGLVR